MSAIETPEIRTDLTDAERLERLERAVITLCQIVDEKAADVDAMLKRANGVLEKIEEEGPSAFLGTLLQSRRRRRRE